MEADLQSFVAFYLTGKKQPARLDDIGGLKLRPALFSGYHDLTRMRYDFPLVLIEEPVGERFAERNKLRKPSVHPRFSISFAF